MRVHDTERGLTTGARLWWWRQWAQAAAPAELGSAAIGARAMDGLRARVTCAGQQGLVARLMVVQGFGTLGTEGALSRGRRLGLGEGVE